MLILGSSSPRRKEILQYFKLPFEQDSPPYDEEAQTYEGDPLAFATKLAKGKALSLAKKHQGKTILTADTVVFKGGQLYGKPKDDQEAFEMLQTFNGKWHTVFTAVVAIKGDLMASDYEQTEVLFHKVPQSDLKLYHKAFLGTDKAGGYGIQMGGSIIIRKIEGCYYNVMGLPIGAVASVLKEMGTDLWQYL
ncbi:MAG: dTTP/UTP pyrophosphatase [Chlamydiales bacterium]|nr:dTTP/UTP pyrophosphatase [Chlamydiales bacterium]MCH9635832.1 dTTP/UTP pyrophosphatase [Chlamydiales bacterium]MCH9704146.1 Maf family nucleotide pyrophosphatase [Chlamydiota bacterium]